jgi:hypothetical protein
MSLRYPNSGVNAAYYNPVACLPGAPTIGTAMATGTSVSLTFTAPGANGGNPITCYIATSNVGGFTGANTSSPISISGLTKNTGYSFTVAARTATGTGASSAASNGILAQGVPNAPTIGTASVCATTASITFTSPTCNGGNAITSYTATSCPGSITGTGSSSPISVSGLTGGTSYTFKVKATNAIGTGPCSSASNSVTAVLPPGSQSYITPGTYTWVAPTGVTSVSVVAIGSGNRSGGGLGYKNNISVTPGNSYSVVVSDVGGTASYFCRSSLVSGVSGQPGTGGGYVGDGGGYGGASGSGYHGGGGGAGGYSGNGGAGGPQYGVAGSDGEIGSGAAAGGSGGGIGYNRQTGSGGGGGTGICGRGAYGFGGSTATCFSFCCNGQYKAYGQSKGGGAGSGGQGGGGMLTLYNYSTGQMAVQTCQFRGGNFGGGRGSTTCYGTPTGGTGAVRIVWPGNTRQFPSTSVGSP